MSHGDECAFIQRDQRGHVRDQKRVGVKVRVLVRPRQTGVSGLHAMQQFVGT